MSVSGLYALSAVQIFSYTIISEWANLLLDGGSGASFLLSWILKEMVSDMWMIISCKDFNSLFTLSLLANSLSLSHFFVTDYLS